MKAEAHVQENPAWLCRLARHSETAALMAAHPWEQTPLGPADHWPEALRVATSLCLSSDFPMLVLWGPELTMVYNEGYRHSLGPVRHPAAVGAPVRDVWPDVWDDIEPLLDQVRDTGRAFHAIHHPFAMTRNGYEEETYFTFCYSPIEVDGEVAGIVDIATETTKEVVAERRLALLGDLAAALVTARDVVDVCTAAAAVLADRHDVVASEILVRVGEQLVPLVTNPGVIRPVIDLDLLQDQPTTDSVVLDPDWEPGTPARQVAIPVGPGHAAGVLVLELNPCRPFDDDHRSFVGLLARTVDAALENADRRSSELGEQQLIGDTLQAAMLEPASDLPTVAARYRPAVGRLAVGGDWYDVMSLDDGRRALVVGDCVGHGLEAATAMGQLRSASRALLLEGRPPSEVLEAMDLFAASVTGGSCATMLCAVMDLAAGTATFARAGHLPPLLVRRGQGTWLEDGKGTPLAVRGRPRTDAVAAIEADDLFLMFSDGLVERRGEGLDVGLERLRTAAEAHFADPVQVIADVLIAELLPARATDDVALLVKRVH